MVIGPGIGGVLIGVLGVGTAYAVDAVSCLAMVCGRGRDGARSRRRPTAPSTRRVLRSIADGLRYVRGNQALVGSFAIDLVAMTFGMPRALFAVLAVSVYRAGAEGTGLLYAAVSAGATVAALTTGWIEHARRLGIIVIWAVVVWGAAIALVGRRRARCGWPPRCSPSPARPTASARCAAARSTRWSPPTRCAGACRRSSRWW